MSRVVAPIARRIPIAWTRDRTERETAAWNEHEHVGLRVLRVRDVDDRLEGSPRSVVLNQFATTPMTVPRACDEVRGCGDEFSQRRASRRIDWIIAVNCVIRLRRQFGRRRCTEPTAAMLTNPLKRLATSA
jgi:hypothetical protein